MFSGSKGQRDIGLSLDVVGHLVILGELTGIPPVNNAVAGIEEGQKWPHKFDQPVK